MTFLFFPLGVVVTISSAPILISIGFSEQLLVGALSTVSRDSDEVLVDRCEPPCQSRCLASRALRLFCNMTILIELCRKIPAKTNMNKMQKMWKISPEAT